jgi:hypothetical protein
MELHGQRHLPQRPALIFMKIHELLKNDIREFGLANQGQSRLDVNEALEEELRLFVCDGQYGKSLDLILSRYLANLQSSKQGAVWVSGFYGSGKSHLLKMLGHLWVDTELKPEVRARQLVAGLPSDVQAHLREIDAHATRQKVEKFSAMGTLPAGSGDMVFATILSVILKAKDLPEQIHLANFVLWLRENGWEAEVRKAVQDAGDNWESELNNFLMGKPIAQTLLSLDPSLAADIPSLRQLLKSRFPNQVQDLTAAEFISSVRRVLQDKDGKLPLGIIILDEVQAYVADNADRSQRVTDAAEIFNNKFGSSLLLVAAGQSALSASTPNLAKLKDRFIVNIQLSDTDVEAVTRKVLLVKKTAAEAAVRKLFDDHSGEITGLLSGTKLNWVTEDELNCVTDYPLLPQQRRFWEHASKAVDPAGTSGQLRSQLRNLLDALKECSEKNLGALIPGDMLYELMAAGMLNNGVLQNDLGNRISGLNNGTEKGRLRQRIAGLVFLINRLSSSSGIDTGVRPDAKTIADLLLTDLKGDIRSFRESVKTELAALVEKGQLMKVGEDYRIQTKQGAEWNQAFVEAATAYNNSNEHAEMRERRFKEHLSELTAKIKLIHGACKERRDLFMHYGTLPPDPSREGVPVWCRDEWAVPESTVRAEASQLGQESPIIHVVVPKKDADSLKTHIVHVLAAKRVIDQRGVQNTPEGREAADAMRARLTASEDQLGATVRGIMAGARVFRSGAIEVAGLELASNIESGARESLNLLYRQFSEADSNRWKEVIDRTRHGIDEPFSYVNHTGDATKHPVCVEVIKLIAEAGNAGVAGGKIRKHFRAPPYGWPQDAVDAALTVLLRSGTLRGRKNGVEVQRDIDQNGIPQVDFIAEAVPVSTQEIVRLRTILNYGGLLNPPVPPSQGPEHIEGFLTKLRELAVSEGIEPPRPEGIELGFLEGVLSLAGGQRVKAMLEKGEVIKKAVDDGKARAEGIRVALPLWSQVVDLHAVAPGLPVAAAAGLEIEAIKASRGLLTSKAKLDTLQRDLEVALRQALKSACDECSAEFSRESRRLTEDAVWAKISSADQGRLISEEGFHAPVEPSAASLAELLAALRSQSITSRRSESNGYRTKVGRLLEAATKLLEPKVQTITLGSALFRSEAEVRAWVEQAQVKLIEAVKKGPVRIN